MSACLGTGTLEEAFVVRVVALRLHPLAIYVGIRIRVPASGLAVRSAISVSGGIAGLADTAVTGGSGIDIALRAGCTNKGSGRLNSATAVHDISSRVVVADEIEAHAWTLGDAAPNLNCVVPNHLGVMTAFLPMLIATTRPHIVDALLVDPTLSQIQDTFTAPCPILTDCPTVGQLQVTMTVVARIRPFLSQ